jgi:hypothetical protein
MADCSTPTFKPAKCMCLRFLSLAPKFCPTTQTVHGFGQDANGELYAMATDTPPNGNDGVVHKLLSFRLTAQVSANQLDLSWPTSGVRLQSQINSPGVGITTNWFDIQGGAGTNHIVVPILNQRQPLLPPCLSLIPARRNKRVVERYAVHTNRVTCRVPAGRSSPAAG